METVRGLSAAQHARDMDSGPDPFAYEPDTVFCDGCGYRVPESDCVKLGGGWICDECLFSYTQRYVEDYSEKFVQSDPDIWSCFLKFFFQKLFGVTTYFTEDRYAWTAQLFGTFDPDDQATYIEAFADRPESGFFDWIVDRLSTL